MHRTCPTCGTTNRIPARHLASAGKCGKCQAALPPQADPIDADGETFADIVQNARVPVLVDFWAAWCGPCRMAAPEVKSVARQAAGRAVVVKVDTESHPELAQRFGVQGIPNFVVLNQGKVVFQQAGLAPAAEMLRWLEKAARAPA